jgi:Uma2 family endonuclease
MGMPAPQPVTTIEELLALPEDGQRHELLDGVHVVTPSPSLRHQWIIPELHRELTTSIGPDANVEVFLSPADVRLGPQTLVQPDIFVIRSDPDDRPQKWEDVGVPLLAIEVLSPSTAARDRGTKRRIYLDAGVEEYWIVDVDGQVVERWTSGNDRPEIVGGELTWTLSTGAAGSIDLQSLFKRSER